MVLSKISQVKQLERLTVSGCCVSPHISSGTRKEAAEGGGGGGGGCVMQQAEAAASVFCVISEKTPNIVTVRAVAGRQATVRVCPCPCLLSV